MNIVDAREVGQTRFRCKLNAKKKSPGLYDHLQYAY